MSMCILFTIRMVRAISFKNEFVTRENYYEATAICSHSIVIVILYTMHLMKSANIKYTKRQNLVV